MLTDLRDVSGELDLVHDPGDDALRPLLDLVDVEEPLGGNSIDSGQFWGRLLGHFSGRFFGHFLGHHSIGNFAV